MLVCGPALEAVDMPVCGPALEAVDMPVCGHASPWSSLGGCGHAGLWSSLGGCGHASLWSSLGGCGHAGLWSSLGGCGHASLWSSLGGCGHASLWSSLGGCGHASPALEAVDMPVCGLALEAVDMPVRPWRLWTCQSSLGGCGHTSPALGAVDMPVCGLALEAVMQTVYAVRTLFRTVSILSWKLCMIIVLYVKYQCQSQKFKDTVPSVALILTGIWGIQSTLFWTLLLVFSDYGQVRSFKLFVITSTELTLCWLWPNFKIKGIRKVKLKVVFSHEVLIHYSSVLCEKQGCNQAHNVWTSACKS